MVKRLRKYSHKLLTSDEYKAKYQGDQFNIHSYNAILATEGKVKVEIPRPLKDLKADMKAIVDKAIEDGTTQYLKKNIELTRLKRKIKNYGKV